MTSDPYAAWPFCFVKPITTYVQLASRIRVIGGPSSLFQWTPDQPNRWDTGTINKIPGFSNWKEELITKLCQKVEEAITEEFGTFPAQESPENQHRWTETTMYSRKMRCYAVGELVKKLWLEIRDGSLGTLTAFFMELSRGNTILRTRLKSTAGSLLFHFDVNERNGVTLEAIKYLDIIPGWRMNAIHGVALSAERDHTFSALPRMLHTRFPHHFDVDQWHLYVWDCCRYIHGYLELKGASYEEEWLKKLKVVCDKVVPEDRQNRRIESIFDLLPKPKDLVLTAIESTGGLDTTREYDLSHSRTHHGLTNRQRFVYKIET